jgi:thioredoxin-related protein
VPGFLHSIVVALLGVCIAAHAAEPSPRAIQIPAWFEETFLDFAADVREAGAAGKRVLVYFGQDGCPYCRRLMEANFSQKDIVDKTRAHFQRLTVSPP